MSDWNIEYGWHHNNFNSGRYISLVHLLFFTDQSEVVYPQLYYSDNTKTSELVLIVRTAKETFYIDLKPNDMLIKQDSSDTRNCHYHGTILSHPGAAAISMCEAEGEMVNNPFHWLY